MLPRGVPPLDPQYIYYLDLGRRAAIKGFDVVIEAFRRAHAVDSSMRLLLVGGGERVDEPGILDIGRSEEPADSLSACDYLISANRQSYFHLSVMESLSLGTPMIIACTGGHRFFSGLGSPGISPIPSADTAALFGALLENRKKRAGNAVGVAANKLLHEEVLANYRYRERLDQVLARLAGER